MEGKGVECDTKEEAKDKRGMEEAVKCTITDIRTRYTVYVVKG